MCRWIVRPRPQIARCAHGVPVEPHEDVPPTTATSVERARQIALGAGIHFVYTGNVHDPAGQTTWCPQCGTALIDVMATGGAGAPGRPGTPPYALPGIFRR